ncbi:hypothetical protein NC651_026606 [Populus alba x Populus x berolinensis]|nr:hypothetical protein NC651_026606 [Populus alba x Populus x berolinensis]
MTERRTERRAKGRPKRKPKGLHLQSSSQQQQHMVFLMRTFSCFRRKSMLEVEQIYERLAESTKEYQ